MSICSQNNVYLLRRERQGVMTWWVWQTVFAWVTWSKKGFLLCNAQEDDRKWKCFVICWHDMVSPGKVASMTSLSMLLGNIYFSLIFDVFENICLLAKLLHPIVINLTSSIAQHFWLWRALPASVTKLKSHSSYILFCTNYQFYSKMYHVMLRCTLKSFSHAVSESDGTPSRTTPREALIGNWPSPTTTKTVLEIAWWKSGDLHHQRDRQGSLIIATQEFG